MWQFDVPLERWSDATTKPTCPIKFSFKQRLNNHRPRFPQCHAEHIHLTGRNENNANHYGHAIEIRRQLARIHDHYLKTFQLPIDSSTTSPLWFRVKYQQQRARKVSCSASVLSRFIGFSIIMPAPSAPRFPSLIVCKMPGRLPR